MTDRLAGFFKQYTFSAQMFYAGTLCKSEGFDENPHIGHLHLIRCGSMTVSSLAHPPMQIHEPSLLFYPRSIRHQLVPNADANVDLVCATVNMEADSGNPLLGTLPTVLLIKLEDMPGMQATLELLFAEAIESKCGRVAAINRLFEYLLIQLLRYIMDQQQLSAGLLAGLADKRLSRAIVAMHNDTARNWSLETLAREAGMSRARFAVYFRTVVGMTPGAYLSLWRISQVQAWMKKGKPMGWIADAVGYSSAAALTRAFKAQIGSSPKAWLNAHKGDTSP